MLSATPELVAPTVPSASDVRGARTIAGGLARSADAEGPTPVAVTAAENGRRGARPDERRPPTSHRARGE